MMTNRQKRIQHAKLYRIKAKFLFGNSERSPEKKDGHWGKVYVLGLEHGCFYIGWTIDLNNRLIKHIFGQGANWTKLHRPLSLIETFDKASVRIEDEITERYLLKYGAEKVRGGKYLTLK